MDTKNPEFREMKLILKNFITGTGTKNRDREEKKREEEKEGGRKREGE